MRYRVIIEIKVPNFSFLLIYLTHSSKAWNIWAVLFFLKASPRSLCLNIDAELVLPNSFWTLALYTKQSHLLWIYKSLRFQRAARSRSGKNKPVQKMIVYLDESNHRDVESEEEDRGPHAQSQAHMPHSFFLDGPRNCSWKRRPWWFWSRMPGPRPCGTLRKLRRWWRTAAAYSWVAIVLDQAPWLYSTENKASPQQTTCKFLHQGRSIASINISKIGLRLTFWPPTGM